MTYLQTHKSSGSRRTRGVLAALVIVVVVILIIQLFRPSFLSALATTIARPFWRAQLSLELGSMNTPESLLAENQFLHRELDNQSVQLASVQSVEDENAELKALLGRNAISSTTSPYILAAVLSSPPLTPYDEIVIDAGDDKGFTVGNNVYAVGNVLIGRISSVLGQTSKVELLSSPGQSYPVRVGPTHAAATAVGRGGGQYEAELPRDIEVSEGDFVLSPSLNDLPFGVVTAVLADPAQPFEKILFAPPVNMFQIRWVLVDPRQRML